jgi:molybdate transport system substrate-binding protein
MKQLDLISAGAAQGLVGHLQDRFRQQTGCSVQGTFGAVGLMLDKLLSGAPCDVVILTEALIAQLERQGRVVAGSALPLGVVRTGIAVKSGQAMLAVDTAAALSTSLRQASAIYFPDPVKATAGIHFMKVLKSLGLDQELAAKLRPFPNGATAMREMAQAADEDLVGCTQVTEILSTPGVRLVAPLPKEFELATVYVAAVCAGAADRTAATAWVGLLAGDDTKPIRRAGGFEAG